MYLFTYFSNGYIEKPSEYATGGSTALIWLMKNIQK